MRQMQPRREWMAGARPLALAAAAMLAVLAQPAMAQRQVDPQLRLERIEAQLRALQRAVFPGGDQRFFEPEITPPQPATPTPAPAPSQSALADVLIRLEALERQVARLTASAEVSENSLEAIMLRLTALEDARAGSGPSTAAATPAPAPTAAPAPAQAATPSPAPAPSAPSAQRLAAVQAIPKPATNDPGDDEYVYGFRLWEAGFYPEAQQQLALFLQRFPNHPRVTYGRNLLGRAYLDAGDPRTAATHFFENYNANKQAARAPDSLLFLAEAMLQLNDTRRACIALAQFGDEYPALATGRLQGQYEGLLRRVSCN